MTDGEETPVVATPEQPTAEEKVAMPKELVAPVVLTVIKAEPHPPKGLLLRFRDPAGQEYVWAVSCRSMIVAANRARKVNRSARRQR